MVASGSSSIKKMGISFTGRSMLGFSYVAIYSRQEYSAIKSY